MMTDHLLRRILDSRDFTAMEKRYLEDLIRADTTQGPPPCYRCAHRIDTGEYTYCARRGVCIPKEAPR